MSCGARSQMTLQSFWYRPRLSRAHVDVEDAAELAGLDDLLELPHRGVVLEGVADHEGDVVRAGALDECLGLLHGGGQRLLHHGVQAGTQCLQRDGRMCAGWRRHHDRVEPVEHVVEPLPCG